MLSNHDLKGYETMELLSTYGPVVIAAVAVVAFIFIALVFKAIKLAVKVTVGLGILALLAWLASNYAG